MLSSEQRAFIEDIYEAASWRGKSPYASVPIRHFALGTVYLHGWRQHRIRHAQTPPPSTNLIVRTGDKLDEITSVASILQWECSSVKAAHEQLLVVLGEIQSNALKRDGASEIGDVFFSLLDTMFLFARGNLVTLVRNAGTKVQDLSEIAATIDAAIVRHLQKSKPSPLTQ